MSGYQQFAEHLRLPRCPHCGIASPSMQSSKGYYARTRFRGTEVGWAMFFCRSCGGGVLGKNVGKIEADSSGYSPVAQDVEIYPSLPEIDPEIPARPRAYLHDAVTALHAPSASILASNSAIDAMLKEKGLLRHMDGRELSLHARIKKAADDHILTQGMAEWAHHVRFEANAQRHADDERPLPSAEEAKAVWEFAKALADYLFVIPARVRLGRENAMKVEQAQ